MLQYVYDNLLAVCFGTVKELNRCFGNKLYVSEIRDESGFVGGRLRMEGI